MVIADCRCSCGKVELCRKRMCHWSIRVGDPKAAGAVDVAAWPAIVNRLRSCPAGLAPLASKKPIGAQERPSENAEAIFRKSVADSVKPSPDVRAAPGPVLLQIGEEENRCPNRAMAWHLVEERHFRGCQKTADPWRWCLVPNASSWQRKRSGLLTFRVKIESRHRARRPYRARRRAAQSQCA